MAVRLDVCFTLQYNGLAMTRVTVALILLGVVGCSGTAPTEPVGDLDPPVVTTVVTNSTDATVPEAEAETIAETDDSTADASSPIVIDVRSIAEWKTGHIDSSVNIPHTEIADRIGEVTNDKAAEILVYCRMGGRADSAKKALEELGFTNVENVGGYEDAKKRFAK